MTVEQLMNRSLAYERAYSRISLIIGDLIATKRADDKAKTKVGEEPDESFGILIESLLNLKNAINDESQHLWKRAESRSEFHEWAMRDLVNAVITSACRDYEMAISGEMSEGEIAFNEKFARTTDNGDMFFTLGISMTDILERIRKNHKAFVNYAHKNYKAIAEETRKNRAARLDLTHNTHKCPNCGGILYEISKFGVHRIACTMCNMSEIVAVDEQRVL